MLESGPKTRSAVALPDEFRAALTRPSTVAVLVDFDGTLAPIVNDPADARGKRASIDTLEALAGRLMRVGVISGRPVSFLEEQLPESIDIAGLYGLECKVDGQRCDHEQGGCWREVVEDLGAHAAAAGPDGMRVETKDLSITLHYREHPEIEAEVEAWAASEASRSGLQARPARRSWELHPPIAVDKGNAVRDLADDANAVCFIGDDHGDLPAFRALDALQEAGCTVLRVAVDSDEADDELLAAADLVVDGPPAVSELLAAMLAVVEA